MEELQWQGTMGTSRQKGGRDAGAKEGGAGIAQGCVNGCALTN